MLLYAMEGLDCSGKKTIARLVQQHFRERESEVVVVIGPLVGGRLGRWDAHLANITTPVRQRSPTDLLRRTLYVAEPLCDRLAQRRALPPTLKVSTHFRAWARTSIRPDPWMARCYALTAPVQLRYAGATLLSTDFDERLRRHAADAANHATAKVSAVRFLGPDPGAFARWHAVLDTLMDRQIPSLLRLDSTSCAPEKLARQITEHVLTCWQMNW